MHNSKMNQTIIKDRIVPGSSEERIVYIGVVCSNFDFACSSATSNIEPLGIEEAFLKDPFLPLFSQQTLWSASTNSFGYIWHWTTVFNIIKEKMTDKGAILAFQYLWMAALLREVVKFPPSPNALCLLLTYHPLTSKAAFTVPGVLHSPHHLTLSEMRWKIHRQLV